MHLLCAAGVTRAYTHRPMQREESVIPDFMPHACTLGTRAGCCCRGRYASYECASYSRRDVSWSRLVLAALVDAPLRMTSTVHAGTRCEAFGVHMSDAGDAKADCAWLLEEPDRAVSVVGCSVLTGSGGSRSRCCAGRSERDPPAERRCTSNAGSMPIARSSSFSSSRALRCPAATVSADPESRCLRSERSLRGAAGAGGHALERMPSFLLPRSDWATASSASMRSRYCTR